MNKKKSFLKIYINRGIPLEVIMKNFNEYLEDVQDNEVEILNENTVNKNIKTGINAILSSLIVAGKMGGFGAEGVVLGTAAQGLADLIMRAANNQEIKKYVLDNLVNLKTKKASDYLEK
jgi:hypothetical protein